MFSHKKKNSKNTKKYKNIVKRIFATTMAFAVTITSGAFGEMKIARAATSTFTIVCNSSLTAWRGASSSKYGGDSMGASSITVDGTKYTNTYKASRSSGHTMSAERDGHTFLGWAMFYTTDGSNWHVPSDFTSSQMVSNPGVWNSTSFYDVEFVPVFSANTYTLNWEGAESVNLKCGQYISKTTKTATKTGYTFNGWKSYPTYMPASNYTIYANWTANEYKVNFDGNGGTSGYPSTSVTYDSTYGNLPTASRLGYTFAGWYTEKTGGSRVTENTKVSTASTHNLYAHWNEENYTVTYKANGGSGSDQSQNVQYSNTWSVKSNPFAKTGYSFAGWNTKADGSGTSYSANSSASWNSTENLTLYAQWKKNNYTVTCIDYCDGIELGRKTDSAAYASTVSGSQFGNDRTVGKYYSEKRYLSASEAIVTENGATVTRQFENYGNSGLDGAVLSDNGDTIKSVSKNTTAVYISRTSGIKNIGSNAFEGCKNLKTVAIETNSLQSISERAFAGCTNLEKIELPYSVSKIESGAFDGCINLKSFTIKNPSCNLSSSSNTIPNTAVIYGFKGSTTVSYAVNTNKHYEYITEITDDFFVNETAMTNFVIPENITEIGDNAFKNCTNLKTVTMGSGVKSIGKKAFEKTGIAAVNIADLTKIIGDSAFNDCTNLKKVNISRKSVLEEIGENAFAHTSLNYTTNANPDATDVFFVPETVETVGKNAFLDCSGLGQITVAGKNTVIANTSAVPKKTVIGCHADAKAYTFANDNNYKIAVFVGFDGNTSVKSNAYAGNTNILTAAFGKNVSKIGDAAFKNCTSLTTIYEHVNKVECVGREAFSGCTSLATFGTEAKKVQLGAKISTIGENAFEGCKAIKDVFVENPNCEIYDSESTIVNTAVLHSYSKSTTFDYANKYNATKSFQKTSISYQIIFNKNGGFGGTDKVYVYAGMEWPNIIAPSRTGYTMNGYYLDDTLCYDENGIFVGSGNESLLEISEDKIGDSAPVAKWDANIYTVVFDGNGATSGDMDNMDMAYDVNDSLSANNYEKTGYTFAGWNTKADGSGKAYKDLAVIRNLTSKNGAAVTLYAQWKANSYTVVFDGNGATSGNMDNMDMAYDDETTLPENDFVKDSDYTFAGWNTEADGSGRAYKDLAVVENLTSQNGATVTLYAQWKPVQKSITYDLAGGKYPDGMSNPQKYTFQDEITLTNPEKEGYEFLGWTGTDLVGYEKNVKILPGNRKDRTYVAHWKLETYGITYELAGGSLENGSINPDTYNVEMEKDITLANPVKRGYTFIGWSEDGSDEMEMEQKIKKGTAGNKVFTANWKVNSYNVEFILNDGTLNASDEISSYTYGEDMSLPKATKKNHVFDGWYENASFTGTPIDTIEKGTIGDKVFYAKFHYQEEKSVQIHYYVGEEEITDDTEKIAYIKNYVKYAKTPVSNVEVSFALPTEVMRAGYNFAGWYADKNLEGTPIEKGIYKGTEESLTYYAKFNPVSYPISFENCEDAEIADLQSHYSYKQNTRLPEKVNRSGYAFAGWYDNEQLSGNPITIVPEDSIGAVTYYAKWTANAFAITYYTNQGSIVDDNVTGYDFGQKVTLPVDVKRTGCTFAGWYDNKEFSGKPVTEIKEGSTGNKTFYAKWNPNTYHVSYVINEGTIKEDAADSYQYNSEVVLPVRVEKSGYNFEGWYDNAEFSGDKISKISTEDYGNKTFYAKWSPNTYRVILNLNGGSLGDKIISYTYGQEVTLLTPVRNGYEFIGWFINADFTGNEILKISAEESGDKTFYACWKKNSQSRNITKTYTIGSLKYKLVSSNGKKTACVIGTKSKKVTKLTIPASVKIGGKKYKVSSISKNAFKNCKKLKKVIIGKNVKKIGKYAFKNCKKLKKITFKTSKVSLSKGVFKGVNKKVTFKVPGGKKKAYKKVIKKSGLKKAKIK